MLQRYLVILATLLVCAIICPAAVAMEITEENLQKIATIDYRGIDFFSSQQDVLQLLPKAGINNNHVGSKKGISTYEVRDDTANDCVLLRFFDDALVEINFIFFPKLVASKGGVDAMTSQVVERFGPPTKQNGNTLFWDFPTIDRIITAHEKYRIAYLMP